MNLDTTLVLFLGFFIAYVNGANDVSKGIATLVGSGVTDYRRAMVWGAGWTAVGGLLSATYANAMVQVFGNGLLTPNTSLTFATAAAILVGAALWVLVATRTGLPVSTTHAIAGSLGGVAAAAHGVNGVQWSAFGGKVFLPLLISPFASLALVVVLLGTLRGFAPAATTDHLHWLTSGLTSLARGMNDAPKIVALLMAALALGGTSGTSMWTLTLSGLVTGGMVVGSLWAGHRVTHVLAEKVTPMDHREGFVGNLVTASLVAAGATLGLPMSTTHVSTGGIIGAACHRRDGMLDRKTVRDMVLAWIVTLPAAALLAIAAFGILRLVVL